MTLLRGRAGEVAPDAWPSGTLATGTRAGNFAETGDAPDQGVRLKIPPGRSERPATSSKDGFNIAGRRPHVADHALGDQASPGLDPRDLGPALEHEQQAARCRRSARTRGSRSPARGCTRTDFTRPATLTRWRGVTAAIGVVAPARWASVSSAASTTEGRRGPSFRPMRSSPCPPFGVDGRRPVGTGTAQAPPAARSARTSAPAPRSARPPRRGRWWH